MQYTNKEVFIICTWNSNTRNIIHELRSDPRTSETTIILIANLEIKPIDDNRLYFIRGDATEENLVKANIAGAKTIIILGDETLDAGNRDAKVVLTTLTIETLNSDIYSIVELEDEANVRHCERARADEIIVRSELSSRLISRSALDHGITKVISTFLSSREGNDIFKIPVPPEMAGNSFLEVFTQMKSKRNSITLAVQKKEDGKVIANPANDLLVEEEDILLIVANTMQL